MEEETTTVRVTKKTLEVLRGLSSSDIRSMTAEIEWLVTQEYARRYSQPNPTITVSEAVKASE